MDGQIWQSQGRPTRKPGKTVGSARSWLLAGESFYLDLPIGKNLEFLATSVKRLGGVVENFLSKDVTCVVSSSQEARQESWNKMQTGAGLKDTQAGSVPSAGLRKDQEGPRHKSMNHVLMTRGKELLHKAIRNRDSSCGNSILTNARSWGIQVIHTEEMLSYIRWLDSKKHRSRTQVKLLASGLQPRPRVVRLKSPFLKIEDESRQLRPVLQQFKNFPELYFLAERRNSPFEPPQAHTRSIVPESQQLPSEFSPPTACHVVPKRRRQGYCECCEEDFKELQLHIQSPRHKGFVLNPSNYATVDNIISELTFDFAMLSESSWRHASGFWMAASEEATVPLSDHTVASFLCAEDLMGQPVSPEGSGYLLNDQGFLHQAEIPLEKNGTPRPFTSHSVQSPSAWAGGNEAPKGSQGVVNAGLKAASAIEVAPSVALQKRGLVAQTSALSRKRKLSSSPSGQAEKKQAWAKENLSESRPGRDCLPGVQQNCSAGYSPPRLDDGTAAARGLTVSTVPLCVPCPPCSTLQFPRECLFAVEEPFPTDISCFKSSVQQSDQNEGPASLFCKERKARTPCHSSSPENGWGNVTGFAGDEPVQNPAHRAVFQRHSPSVPASELAQAAKPQQQCLDLLLPSCPLTSCLPAGENSSSSDSEWDAPLLCMFAGAACPPLERPIDAALLRTCVNVQDSGYESHLCSVLWQSPEPHWACKEDSKR